jgi:hypothetical protein
MDFDDRLYRFAELYGCVPGRPDEGLRLSHREIAERILAVEASEGIGGRRILRLSDPTCFNKTPDARGGGQGPSSAEDFARAGVVLQPGDPNRKQGIRQFHERLRIRPDAERDQDGRLVELPMLVVYDTCEAFIRTIPLLNPDPRKPDDVDTRQEDHVYDEAKLACMGRPLRTGFDGPVAGGASAGRGIQTLKAGRAF